MTEYPVFITVTAVTQANPCVVSFASSSDFTPGQIVSFRIPSIYGMYPLNNKSARVLRVTNSNPTFDITIDLNTCGFPPFSVPADALEVAAFPALCLPIGSGVVPKDGSATNAEQPPRTNLLDAFDNRPS